MSDYKRNYLPGGTYFFTVNLKNRNSYLLVNNFKGLQDTINIVKTKRPFTINAWVVLPEHIHCIWKLPENDEDYSGRWRAIKTMFCKNIGNSGNSSKKIWQPRFWEHTILSFEDYTAHFNYIHINPVKHGHVKNVVDWPYSSFHFYVKKGVYNNDWGAHIENVSGIEFGE